MSEQTMSALPADYAERVYAGVLGKVIGVYLGRPFEGWTYERIIEHLGEIEDYVHDKLDVPLIVTDDDISGTFTFVRSLADNAHRADLSAADIGRSWLNYLIRERTVLWWGGLGNSTEHTAYLRLEEGIEAPMSGSMDMNGKVVSEQIGAQIFIDGWAMVAPGDPDQAVRFAEEAARVSHDGEAVYGAKIVAAMEALAFVESDVNRILDGAVRYIPDDSVIARLIGDVREWHAQHNDWRDTRQAIADNYGYDKYGGNCHMVPNHALIIASILHSNDDFGEAMKIINTCGWDTDCNSGNVGCFMGIKNGIPGINQTVGGTDWRTPVADRLYMPTAEGGRAISDCATESIAIANMGRALRGEAPEAPKGGAQFHFTLPGSVQGFEVIEGEGAASQADGMLEVEAHGVTRVGTPTFIPSKETARYFEGRGYALMASPRVHPGQVLTAHVASADGPFEVALCVDFYGEDDEPGLAVGDFVHVDEASPALLTFVVPDTPGPISKVGLSIRGEGRLRLDWLKYEGPPHLSITRPAHNGTMWRRSFVNGVDQFTGWGETFRLIQNRGTGLLSQGSREWTDYRFLADVTPHLARSAGIAVRVQGMRRYYAFVATPGKLQIVKCLHEKTVLAEIAFEWSFGQTLQMELEANDQTLTAYLGGEKVLSATDTDAPLEDGGVALLIEEGRTATQEILVTMPR